MMSKLDANKNKEAEASTTEELDENRKIDVALLVKYCTKFPAIKGNEQMAVENIKQASPFVTTVASLRAASPEFWQKLDTEVRHALRETFLDLRKNDSRVKSWTFSSNVTEQNYWIDPSTLQLGKMIERVKSGGCALVQGAFRSGKSTHLTALWHRLKTSGDYIPLIIPSLVLDGSEQDFWQAISKYCKLQMPNLPEITRPEDFIQIFSEQHFGQRYAVLLFDEVQAIIEHPFKQSFLAAIKTSIDLSKTFGRLQAVLCFGTYSLTKIAVEAVTKQEEEEAWKRDLSPFPQDNTIYISPLPEEATKGLFKQYGNDVGISFTDAVLDDIFITTNGYAGLVGFVGLQLATSDQITAIRFNTIQIDLPVWMEIRNLLPQKLNLQEQFQKLVRHLRTDATLKEFAWRLLAMEEPFTLESEETSNATILSDYGLIRFDPTAFQWSVSSILLRELIYTTCVEGRPDVGRWDYALINQPADLLTKAISYFDLEMLRCCGVNKTTNFPSEYTFQGELFAVLRQAFSRLAGHRYIVMLEAKKQGSRRRSDILAQNGMKIVFETKSAQIFSGQQSVLEECVAQTVEYAELHQAQVAILVNFVHNQLVGRPHPPRKVGDTTVLYIFEVMCKDDFTSMTIC